MLSHQQFMARCLELAELAAGYTAPNPMVGALLVHEGKIIGEGYHQHYGEAHAEPNCIQDAIRKGFSEFLHQSTLYVSLEPCAHFGKTPPCSDLIIRHKIPRVVVGCRDPFPEVDGKGIEKLKANAVAVEVGILEKECRELNKRFLTFHLKRRPYIILKWAQTSDGFIGNPGNALVKNGNGHPDHSRLMVSNHYSNRLVHKWRTEEASILVGTNTAAIDDPELTNRWWPGHSPLRLVVDMDLKLNPSLKIFNSAAPTVVFNTKKHSDEKNWSILTDHKMEKGIFYWQVERDTNLVHQIISALHHLKVQSVLVEGGAALHQSFIDEGSWDESRIIINAELSIMKGLPAPLLKDQLQTGEWQLGSDHIEIFANKKELYHPGY